MENIIGKIGNYVLVDVVRHVDASLAHNSSMYVGESGCVVLGHGNWNFRFEGDGIVRVSNAEFPEIDNVCCDDHAHYAQGKKEFLEVCKDRFMREVRSRERSKRVAEILGAEAKLYSDLYADGVISAKAKNYRLEEIASRAHKMDVWHLVMTEEEE